MLGQKQNSEDIEVLNKLKEASTPLSHLYTLAERSRSPIFYLNYLLSNNKAEFGQDIGFSLALVSTGLMTVIPLLLFNAATTRLPLTITGLLQYITPSIMFLIGIVVFHEPLQLTKLIGFIFIWIALVILGRDLRKSGGSIN